MRRDWTQNDRAEVIARVQQDPAVAITSISGDRNLVSPERAVYKHEDGKGPFNVVFAVGTAFKVATHGTRAGDRGVERIARFPEVAFARGERRTGWVQ